MKLFAFFLAVVVATSGLTSANAYKTVDVTYDNTKISDTISDVFRIVGAEVTSLDPNTQVTVKKTVAKTFYTNAYDISYHQLLTERKYLPVRENHFFVYDSSSRFVSSLTNGTDITYWGLYFDDENDESDTRSYEVHSTGTTNVYGEVYNTQTDSTMTYVASNHTWVLHGYRRILDWYDNRQLYTDGTISYGSTYDYKETQMWVTNVYSGLRFSDTLTLVSTVGRKKYFQEHMVHTSGILYEMQTNETDQAISVGGDLNRIYGEDTGRTYEDDYQWYQDVTNSVSRITVPKNIESDLFSITCTNGYGLIEFTTPKLVTGFDLLRTTSEDVKNSRAMIQLFVE